MTDKPHYQLFIDGAWVEGGAGQVLQSLNPATGEPWASFACASAEDVDRAFSSISAASRYSSFPRAVWVISRQT
ncbi:MAG: hypothetical protein AAFZ06_09040, partial [Pseudomonadota bacterium]